MLNLLLFGGSGFVGRNFIKKYYKNYKIFSCGRTAVSEKNVENIYCNLKKKINFSKLPKKIDKIIYLAQEPEYVNFPSSSDSILNINFLRFYELLKHCADQKISGIIYLSSGGIYGLSKKPVKESDWVKDYENNWKFENSKLNFYFKTKIMSEIVANSYRNIMKICILRPFFIYGPGNRENALFNKIIKRISHSEPIILDSQEGIRISTIHIIDAVDAINHCIKKNLNDTFNLCGKETYTLKQISEMIAELLGKKVKFRIKNKKKGTLCIAGNSSKIKSTGWNQNFNLMKGLKESLYNLNKNK